MNYLGYELKDYIVNAIKDLGFKEFTPVQRGVFDSLLKEDKNIVGKSKTGTGKTHAFLIPIFNNCDFKDNMVYATIVAPTKELALQIYKVAQHLASFSPDEIRIKLYSGGTDREKEIEKLQNRQPHIVIGTPGKISDLTIKENVLKIYTSKYFIVDEVDMTFDQGFKDDLEDLTNICSSAKKMAFSATIREDIRDYLKKFMTNVNYIEIDSDINQTIKHIWIPLKYKDKNEMLISLTHTFNPYLCLVFVNKKEDVLNVLSILSQEGYNVGRIDGSMSPRERKRVIVEATDLKYQYIVATDLAARGIDIPGVSHIINYDIPYDFEFYIHRSGRTGRMYNDGIVYTFYGALDDTYLDNLASRGVKPTYFEIKQGELVPYRGRNIRETRVKPKSEYEIKAQKFVPKPTKVKPGYKKKRQAEIEKIAKSLKSKDNKKKWYY